MLYIAVLVIFLGTIFFVVNQHITNKINTENKLANVVNKINDDQEYSYDTLKKQQRQLYGINDDLQLTKKLYLKKIEAEEMLDTKKMYATDAYVRNNLTFLNDGKQIRLNKNNISFSNRDLTLDADNIYLGKNNYYDTINNKTILNGDLKVDNKLTIGENSYINEKNDTLNLNTGFNMNDLNVRDYASLNNLDVGGNQSVYGSLSISGGKSALNTLKRETIFNDNKTGKNFIRGDTDIFGNTSNIGNINIESNLNVNGKSVFNKNVKIGYDNNLGYDTSIVSAYAPPNTTGASFGSVLFSHLPFQDQNTYIRAGNSNKNIYIGDVGNTNSVIVGYSNTLTNVKGDLQVDGQINLGNSLYVSKSNTKFNNMYTVSGANGSTYTMSNDGSFNINNDIYSSSIGRALNDNKMFGINTKNVNNNAHPGTELVQGLSITKGGGLAVSSSTQKVPQGSLIVEKTIKAGHSNTSTMFDNVAISTNVNNTIGAMLGGPDSWSYFPNSNGTSIIRPGKKGMDIVIGDINTSNVYVGTDTNNISIGDKLMTSSNGTILRAGFANKDLIIGDALTSNINIGGSAIGSILLKSSNVLINNSIDSANVNKKLFTGWNSHNTIIGNPTTGGSNYVNRLPINSTGSANDFYVYGKNTASTQLCINDTCINEADLMKIKAWL